MIYKVYCLKENDIIKYIGITERKLNLRLNGHISDIKRNRNPKKCEWIKKIIENGAYPIIEIIEDNLTENEVYEREIFWIKYYKDLGIELLNKTDGGEKNYMSEETKKVLSDKMKGRFIGEKNPMYGKKREDLVERNLLNHPMKNKELREKMSVYFKEKYSSDEYKIKHMLSQKNRKEVYQYTFNDEFIKKWNSINEIKRIMGYDTKSIRLNCLNKSNHAYGYKWKFNYL